MATAKEPVFGPFARLVEHRRPSLRTSSTAATARVTSGRLLMIPTQAISFV